MPFIAHPTSQILPRKIRCACDPGTGHMDVTIATFSTPNVRNRRVRPADITIDPSTPLHLIDKTSHETCDPCVGSGIVTRNPPTPGNGCVFKYLFRYVELYHLDSLLSIQPVCFPRSLTTGGHQMSPNRRPALQRVRTLYQSRHPSSSPPSRGVGVTHLPTASS